MVVSRVYKAEGIVIRRKNIGESDKTISLYTKEFGKISVLAKGIRRITSRRSGHLDLFNHVAITVYHGSSRDIVQEASRIDGGGNMPIDSSLPQVIYSYFVCELIDRLTPEWERHDEVFSLLRETLFVFRTKPNRLTYNESLERYTESLLLHLGYLPKNTRLRTSDMIAYIEQITERKLLTPAILTALRSTQ